jgi:hypothetical protein
MSSALVFAIVAGLVFWAIAGYAIWRWGPGLRKRSVWCPVLKRRARVLADQREAEFGSLMAVDVKSCSLIKGQALTCGKECLWHQ